MLPSGEIAMFDDEAGPPMKAPSSRGLILALDLRRRTAAVVHSYRRPADTSAQSEGSVQIVPGGDVFLGFGSEPSFSEFTASGRMVSDAALLRDDGSYRAYRFAWTATPAMKPAVVARRVDATRIAVDVSWNGATRVARWQVLAGRAASSVSPRAIVPKCGFETHIELASSAPLIAVRALDASGHVLVRSGAVRVG
jgi:Arylsulfotransferase (ASST)